VAKLQLIIHCLMAACIEQQGRLNRLKLMQSASALKAYMCEQWCCCS
jgi:hypothetical protein